MNIEQKVLDLLSTIKADDQLNKDHKDYLGFVNCMEDGWNFPSHNEAYADLCKRPQYYKCLMNMGGLTTESGFDLDETIFILK